jgi:HD-like signal output (HDOD) protein
VQMIDDPSSSASGVAAAARIDPALTARMLRMANSAYYGLSGRVASASFAVTVIGFQTVRSLAAMSAAGLLSDGELPPDFWAQGATTAAGTALVARRVGADVAAAFCAGILHDLGTALLWRHDRERHARLLSRVTATERADALELQEYGASHAGLCADVLNAWHFPEDLCVAIGRHHDTPSAGASPLRRALQAGIALAEQAHGSADGHAAPAAAALEAAGIARHDRPAMVAQVRREGAELAGALLA